jgi:hypothetical protein
MRRNGVEDPSVTDGPVIFKCVEDYRLAMKDPGGLAAKKLVLGVGERDTQNYERDNDFIHDECEREPTVRSSEEENSGTGSPSEILLDEDDNEAAKEGQETPVSTSQDCEVTDDDREAASEGQEPPVTSTPQDCENVRNDDCHSDTNEYNDVTEDVREAASEGQETPVDSTSQDCDNVRNSDTNEYNSGNDQAVEFEIDSTGVKTLARGKISPQCAKCKQENTEHLWHTSEIIACDRCDKWFHYDCTMLPAYMLAHYDNRRKLPYKCVECVLIPDYLQELGKRQHHDRQVLSKATQMLHAKDTSVEKNSQTEYGTTSRSTQTIQDEQTKEVKKDNQTEPGSGTTNIQPVQDKRTKQVDKCEHKQKEILDTITLMLENMQGSLVDLLAKNIEEKFNAQIEALNCTINKKDTEMAAMRAEHKHQKDKWKQETQVKEKMSQETQYTQYKTYMKTLQNTLHKWFRRTHRM